MSKRSYTWMLKIKYRLRTQMIALKQ